MERKGGIVVFCAHPISDPLVYALMLDYVKKLRPQIPDHAILFFTEEGPSERGDPRLERELAHLQIEWYPLRYDVGGRQWLQKARNIWQMTITTWKFTRRCTRPLLMGFLSYGGSYSILIGKLLRLPAVTVCFEPHSQYMRDLAIWSENSWKYKIVEAIERLQITDAFELVVPTKAVYNYVMGNGRREVPLLQAVTIDVDQAAFDAQQRRAIRDQFGLEDRIVFAYVGKFGGIYHNEKEHIAFIDAVLRADERYHYMVISSGEHIEALRAALSGTDLEARVTLIPPVASSVLHTYLSAADLGVIAIPPSPSQAFRTPVKTAYYWAAGLPIVIPYGISDDHELAKEQDLGVVIGDLVKFDITLFKEQVDRLMEQDRSILRDRCLNAARHYRDTSKMVEILQKIIRRAIDDRLTR